MYVAKLLNVDRLRQSAVLLNLEGTFGNQEGMITSCRLAKRAYIKLVSCFKWILKRNFRNASFLSLIWTWLFRLNEKENRHTAKCKRIFPSKNVLISSLKKGFIGDGCCRTKQRVTELNGCQTPFCFAKFPFSPTFTTNYFLGN